LLFVGIFGARLFATAKISPGKELLGENNLQGNTIPFLLDIIWDHRREH